MAVETNQYDIKVNNAFKSYGEKHVINGLNMTVQSGFIYGLLGPSGCGKSTLLECILGIIKLDSGSIDLKANYLSDVGYTPQELCLEDLLTIKEIFEYYGMIYNLSKRKIMSRIDYLQKFLLLPDINKYIKNLSGGQARRVSLAISLLHDPKIIILDEPTVGIDPLLKQEIWNEFLTMTKHQKKTIIITTHYIEEATRADCIGLMSDGKIIEEKSPQHILMKYNTDTLESAFLELCCKQKKNKVSHNNMLDVQIRQDVQTQSTFFIKSEQKINTTNIKALIKKNTGVFSRDYVLVFVLFLLPIIEVFIVCLGYGIDIKGINIAIKNDEINLTDCYHYKTSGCVLDHESSKLTMSCTYINYLLELDYKLIKVEDHYTDTFIMKKYQSVAFLYFPQNFTKNLVDYIGENRTAYTLDSAVKVNFARDNIILKNQILKDLFDSLNHLIEKTLYECSNNPKALSVPIKFLKYFGKNVKSHLNYMIGLFYAILIFYFPCLFSVSIMLSEKMDGLLGRSLLAGVKITELLISLFCITTVILLVQMTLPILIGYVLFSNPIIISSSLVIYFITMIFLGWIGFFVGILIAVTVPSKLGGVYVLDGLSMCQILISGFIWPIEGQVGWLRSISRMIPTSIGGTTLNNIALKGLEWNYPSVVNSIVIMFMQIVILVLVLISLGKIKPDIWILKK